MNEDVLANRVIEMESTVGLTRSLTARVFVLRSL